MGRRRELELAGNACRRRRKESWETITLLQGLLIPRPRDPLRKSTFPRKLTPIHNRGIDHALTGAATTNQPVGGSPYSARTSSLVSRMMQKTPSTVPKGMKAQLMQPITTLKLRR